MNPLKLYTELSVATYIVLIFGGQSAKIVFEIKNQNYVQDKKLPFYYCKRSSFYISGKKESLGTTVTD